jgi:uncharacterized Fe-S cluster-containing radical SAM superfamily enzyme
MYTMRDEVVALKETLPKISVDDAIAALTLTGDNSADLIRIVEYAFDIVGKLSRNVAAQWMAAEMLAARLDQLTASGN